MATSNVRDIILIGGSAGAIEGTMSIVRQLPVGLPAAIAVVVHHNERSPNVFGAMLDRLGTLPAITVSGEAELQLGRIYVPETDRHLIIEPGRLLTVRTAKENRARPAVDPLFRSAAKAYGLRTLAVVLSGNLDDGTAGLLAIKKAGGVTAVQDPADALFDGMPSSALAVMDVDYRLPLAEIPSLLVRAVEGQLRTNGKRNAAADNASALGAAAAPPPRDDVPVSVTCPSCHGALSERVEEGSVTFSCHTGHRFGIETLLADQDDDIELALWSAVRALQEKIFFLGKLIKRGEAYGLQAIHARHVTDRTRLEHHVATLRRVLETG